MFLMSSRGCEMTVGVREMEPASRHSANGGHITLAYLLSLQINFPICKMERIVMAQGLGDPN